MKARYFLALTLLLGGGVLRSVGAESVPLPEQSLPGLADLLHQSVRQSPRMINRNLELEIAENDRIAARAAMLPTVGGYYRDSQSRDSRADQVNTLQVRKVAYDLNINQPIFAWGEKRNTARMGEIRQKIALGQYQEAYRLLAQEIRAKYLALITQKTFVERSRYNQKFMQEQLRIAEDKYAKKIFSDLDMFGPRLNAERAQLDLERAEYDYDFNKRTLARMAGVPAIADESLPADVPPVPGTYSEALFEGLVGDYLRQKDLPSVEAASLRQQLDLDELDYQNQRVRLRPKFSLTAGANQDEQSYSLNVAQRYRVNSLYVGVQVNWTIFDSFASTSAIRTALARRRQHENEYSDMHERLAAQAQSQSKQIYFSSRNLSIQERFLDSAVGNLRSKQDEFKRGLISDADVSQVTLYLYDTRIATGNARADYYQKVGELLGTLNNDPVVTNAPVKP
jgi:outer membrane protein TolC